MTHKLEKIKQKNKKSILVVKDQKGSSVITTPVMIALGVLFVSILLVFAIKILTPYIWYEKLSSTCLKYIFVMEEYGYLSHKEKKALESELLEQGFQKKELKIYCTDKKQEYGNPIYLRIHYRYNLKLPLMGDRDIEMNINRESISKR